MCGGSFVYLQYNEVGALSPHTHTHSHPSLSPLHSQNAILLRLAHPANRPHRQHARKPPSTQPDISYLHKISSRSCSLFLHCCWGHQASEWAPCPQRSRRQRGRSPRQRLAPTMRRCGISVTSASRPASRTTPCARHVPAQRACTPAAWRGGSSTAQAERECGAGRGRKRRMPSGTGKAVPRGVGGASKGQG